MSGASGGGGGLDSIYGEKFYLIKVVNWGFTGLLVLAMGMVANVVRSSARECETGRLHLHAASKKNLSASRRASLPTYLPTYLMFFPTSPTFFFLSSF